MPGNRRYGQRINVGAVTIVDDGTAVDALLQFQPHFHWLELCHAQAMGAILISKSASIRQQQVIALNTDASSANGIMEFLPFATITEMYNRRIPFPVNLYQLQYRIGTMAPAEQLQSQVGLFAKKRATAVATRVIDAANKHPAAGKRDSFSANFSSNDKSLPHAPRP